MPLYGRIFKRKSFCILASLQMFLILALRANSVGVDFVTYDSAFSFISTIDFADMLSRIRIIQIAELPYPFSMESGWMILNWMVSHIGLGFRSITVLCAAINMYAVGKFIYKYSTTPWLSFCIFAGFGVYQYMFGILRQSLTLSLIILAVDAYYEKKKVRALLVWVATFFIHRTALLGGALFFLIEWNNADKSKFKVLLLAWIPFVMLMPLIYSKLFVPIISIFGKSGYAGHMIRLNNMMLLTFFVGILTAFFYKFSNSSTSMERMFVWSVIVLIYWSAFGMFNDILSRTQGYFSFFLSMEIPLVLYHYRPKKVAQCGRFAVFILLLAFMIYSLKGSELVPYMIFYMDK